MAPGAILNNLGQSDARPQFYKRQIPMQVLSLGYSQTGTMTMKAALEILGIPTYHYIDMVECPADMDLWENALNAKFNPMTRRTPFKLENWDDLLAHHGAVVDYPACVFHEELIATYPEAKVILVERDVDEWYESYNNSVIKEAAYPLNPILRIIDPAFFGKLGDILDIVTKYYFNVKDLGDKDAAETWRRNAKETYITHNQRVKLETPKDRLLLFKLEQGWRPLCDFLGKEVPEQPFPEINETKEVDARAAKMLRKSFRSIILSWFTFLLPVIIAGLIMLWVFSRPGFHGGRLGLDFGFSR